MCSKKRLIPGLRRALAWNVLNADRVTGRRGYRTLCDSRPPIRYVSERLGQEDLWKWNKEVAAGMPQHSPDQVARRRFANAPLILHDR